ncbi:hypothetical protein [Streptomyces nojiriensis]|uniref:hypothetical protein n=1 Tax=Streptomyces nojiriensis TaxID=66374 RepID=UPI0036671333
MPAAGERPTMVAARVYLRETVTALRAPTAPGTPYAGLPDAAVRLLEEALGAVARVDAATGAVMRERRPRS